MSRKFMDNFLKRKVPNGVNNVGSSRPSRLRQEPNSVRNSAREDISWEEIQFDPSKRKAIDEYHSNHREKQELAFRGHDESKNSSNKGNFREFVDCLAEHDRALAKAVTQDTAEIGHDVFCLLVDESRDISCKEQMEVVLGYVDRCGHVKESFVGLVHVTDTSFNLKSCIDALFAKYKLSLKQVRGQGYNGANNMRGHGVFYWLIRELDSRFNETSSQLLICSAAFNPRDSFHDFNVETLMSLAKVYPNDFDSMKLRELDHHLCLYIADV
ncbi:uncharacterized protein LOC133908252 [Phragmites australis]|uniref:uncharacterized protein LOC133908252 n=1 Tax=Phragmites australis TaxID=29695 RepID=UPI002D76C8A0|nr:uncharacterized protein LOC133908252 [Phragmites australis]